MFYIYNDEIYDESLSEELKELATDIISDEDWERYSTDKEAWTIENGKLKRNKSLDDITKEQLRKRRETECFPIINRGAPWYDALTDEQKNELKEWYKAYLDITDTYIEKTKNGENINLEDIIPVKPQWLK